MKSIAITRGSFVIVDDEDYDTINNYKWALMPRENTCYAVRKGRMHSGEPCTVQMHRQIVGFPSDVQIDHINGNGLDNRKSNLRTATVQTNAFNRRKPKVMSTSRFKGVIQRKKKITWEARVKYNEKGIHLGTYSTEEEAAAAYNHGAILMYGEYACLNVVDRELSPETKKSIYERCFAQVLKRGWHPETGVFLDPQNLQMGVAYE